RGTATITVILDDGQAENSVFSQSFDVEIRPVNQPPSITAVPDRITLEDVALSLPIAVSDDSGTDNLQLSGFCSNSNLVSSTNIIFRGAGLNRIVTITPNTNQVGAATITLTITDTNGSSARQTFN